MIEPRLIWRVGVWHNKWLISLPKGSPRDVSEALPLLAERAIEIHGDNAITKFDHVEYLGEA